MALNETDRELLAVVKYYNDNKKGVIRLVNKLANSFDLTSISHVTGFSVDEIGDILDASPKPKARKSRAKKPIQPDPVIATVEESKSTKPRRGIILHAGSDLAERLAHDLSMHIANNMQPGDKWLSQKTIMQKFECTAASAAGANGALLEYNWIEQVEPGNFRKGYVVK